MNRLSLTVLSTFAVILLISGGLAYVLGIPGSVHSVWMLLLVLGTWLTVCYAVVLFAGIPSDLRRALLEQARPSRIREAMRAITRTPRP